MIEFLRKRRSIRKYTQQRIEPEKIEILKEAAIRSPSSRNINPWQFVFVDDTGLIQKLAGCKEHGSAFMAQSQLAVIVLAEGDKSDVWVEDCSVASILLQLTAQSLGLGSCWVQIRNRFKTDSLSSEDHIKELIKAPANMCVESIIAIGYPDEKRDGVAAEELDRSKIIINHY